jgi:hypothetical protein
MHRTQATKLGQDFDRIERARLARAILQRPSSEVAAIAADNPALVHEWMSEIRRSHEEAEAEARMMASALRHLMRSGQPRARTAA